MPKGKLPSNNVAVVYLAPEILRAARKTDKRGQQRDGGAEGGGSSSVTLSPQADTFAFAKVRCREFKNRASRFGRVNEPKPFV
jgi:hypothetical protein